MSMTTKLLMVKWRHDRWIWGKDRLMVYGSLELPEGYQPADLEPEVTVVVEIGGIVGTDTVSMKKTFNHWWYYKPMKKHDNGTNLEIRKLKIKWARKFKPVFHSQEEGQAKFYLDADLSNMTDDSTGVVSITILIPVLDCGDLSGGQAVISDLYKHFWYYRFPEIKLHK